MWLIVKHGLYMYKLYFLFIISGCSLNLSVLIPFCIFSIIIRFHTHSTPACIVKSISTGECMQGYGLLLESSVTFLMLCWTQTLCWSSSCSLIARSSSSALRSISLSAISLVLQPGPTPLKHKNKRIFNAHAHLMCMCWWVLNRTQTKHAEYNCLSETWHCNWGHS